ncbi:MAG: TetR/AcrR family transcriptional regulator [Deltaproteobacteria bacterium]|nr:MAG: TetR/AcrR family transcriptional regulator [Deltaproteobacteria bacterium]
MMPKTERERKKEVKTRIKSSKLIQERRRQIIEGAIRVFTAKGFHGATVREIAEEAGLTMGSLYNYVESKEDIIYIVYDYITEILRNEVKQAIKGLSDPKQRLKVAILENLKSIHRYQDIVMFIYKESAHLDKESLYDVLTRETEYIQLFEDLVRDYFKDVPIDEKYVRLAGDLLTYIPVIMTFRRWSLRRRFSSIEEIMQGILSFVLHGLEFVPVKSDSEGETNGEKSCS